MTVLDKVNIDDVKKELCERSLHSYMRSAWHLVETGAFNSSWHIEAVCEHLEAVTRGQIRNLIINIPPRHTKSTSVCVMWPSWEWGPANKPQTRWLFTSHSEGLSLRDSVRCREIIKSRWYQQRWGYRYSISGIQDAKERYTNTRGGQRVASTIGGLGTGEGGDRIVVDDPHKVKEAHSSAARESVHRWWDETMASRLNDPKKSSKVLIMQRVHADDLVGHILKHFEEDYETLILPAEYDPKRSCVTSLGWEDPRTKEGDLLWPGRFDKKELDGLKHSLGPYAYPAQYNQAPAPIEGTIFKQHWMRHYSESPAEIAQMCEMLFQSWDMTFSDKEKSDFVCGLVWGIKGANVYLIDRINERLEFTATIAAVLALTNRWPKAITKVVEDKANGPAVISQLKLKVPGFVTYSPTESKFARAISVTPLFEAGNVWLPSADHAPWVVDYIVQMTQFPKGSNDDDVDSTSQALIKARELQAMFGLELPKIFAPKKATGFTPQHGTSQSIYR